MFPSMSNAIIMIGSYWILYDSNGGIVWESHGARHDNLALIVECFIDKYLCVVPGTSILKLMKSKLIL